MSGYVTGMGSCLICASIFQFNPNKVPSMRARKDKHGNLVRDPSCGREPICGSCMARINEGRSARGEELIEEHPLAYEAIPEDEL